MAAKLAIVILNWNGKRFLAQFLPTLLENIPDYAEVIIADNGSTDDSLSFLKSNFPKIRIIKNNENGGFSKGYNDALMQIDAPYFCLLNSDIEVTKNWIEPIMELFESDSEIAVIQPKLLDFYNRNKFEYAGASGGFIDFLGYPFCRGRVFSFLEEDENQYDTPIEVFWATGAAMFVRSEIFNELGGLDEDFFAHMEEIDFCWRVKNSGKKVLVQPKSVVYHVGGGTLPKKSSKKTYLNFRNNMFLLIKNLPRNQWFKVFFIRLLLDQAAAMFFLAQGHFRDFIAVYRAQLSFFRQFSKMKKKRKKPDDRVYCQTYSKSIAFQHYIKKKKQFDGSNLT